MTVSIRQLHPHFFGEVSGVDLRKPLTPQEAAREQVWLALSDALDAADDPQGLLTRLALALGSEAGPEEFSALLDRLG